MKKKTQMTLIPWLGLGLILWLNVGSAPAQTPGQIPVFDQSGTGSCNLAAGSDCVDSVITQAGANIGIGNPNPVQPLAVGNVGTHVPGGGTGFAIVGQSAVGAADATSNVDQVTYIHANTLGGIFGLNAYDYFANAPLPITIGWGGLTFIDLAREGGLVQIGRTGYGADLLVNRDLNVTGKVVLGNIPSTGGVYPLCVNGPSNKTIAYCSSSLRYKTDVRPFLGGLAIIERLRPIAFTWKEGGAHDIGLGAEEVNRVEPLLTFRNDQGEIEGVRYNQLSAVFVNAFIEQQAQIRYQQKRIEDLERQQTQIQQQQEEITTLKALVCGLRPDADVCR